MKDQAPEERAASDSPHEVWTGRATNRAQWLLACAGAACLALGIELAVDSLWTSGVLALTMSVVGCIAVGLLMLFGTLAFAQSADGNPFGPNVGSGRAGSSSRQLKTRVPASALR